MLVPTRPVVAALVLSLVLAAGGHATAQGQRDRSAASGLLATHGRVHQAGGFLVDDRGRAVVAHGVNVVRKIGPRYPTQFTEQDARFLASQGFTVVRLGLLWAGIEPRPGRYDETYLARFVRLDRMLARYGIRTIVDLHQDTFGETYDGDGAPAWASLAPATPMGYELAWKDFWEDAPAADGVGIQTRFVRMWRHVAAAFAPSDNVLGYDPLNEPQPGAAYPPPCFDFLPCAPLERGALTTLYLRVIAAVRSVDPRRLMLLEGVAQNGIEEPGLPRFDDPQTAFNMHLYCPVFIVASIHQPTFDQVEDVACPAYEERGLQTYRTYAQRLGVALLDTEFSAADTHHDTARVVDLFGAQSMTWTVWSYYTALGDPSNTTDQGLLVDDAKPGSVCNAKAGKLDGLVVPHPQAVAGTPRSSRYDRASRTLTFTYDPRPVARRLVPGSPTQLFVPQRVYPTGYQVSVTGGRVTSAPGSPWVTVAASGRGVVSVVIRPATGSRTRTPLPVGTCHA